MKARAEDAETFQGLLLNNTMKLGATGTGCFRATFTDGIRSTIRADVFFVKLRLSEAGQSASKMLSKLFLMPIRLRICLRVRISMHFLSIIILYVLQR